MSKCDVCGTIAEDGTWGKCVCPPEQGSEPREWSIESSVERSEQWMGPTDAEIYQAVHIYNKEN